MKTYSADGLHSTPNGAELIADQLRSGVEDVPLGENISSWWQGYQHFRSGLTLKLLLWALAIAPHREKAALANVIKVYAQGDA